MLKAFTESSLKGYEEVASLIYQIDPEWIEYCFGDIVESLRSYHNKLHYIILYQRLMRAARNSDRGLFYETLIQYQLDYQTREHDKISMGAVAEWVQRPVSESDNIDFIVSVTDVFATKNLLEYGEIIRRMLIDGKYELVVSLLKLWNDSSIDWNDLIISDRPDAFKLIKLHLPKTTLKKSVSEFNQIGNGSILREYLKKHPKDYATLIQSHKALPADQYIKLIERIPLSFEMVNAYEGWLSEGYDYLVLLVKQLRTE